MKVCRKCNENKELCGFAKRSKSSDGLNTWCKPCVKIHNKNCNFEPKTNIIKKCSCCKELKHSSNFYCLKKSKDGLDGRCKQCNILRKDKSNYKNKYNLTIEEYNEILKGQNNCCKICSSTNPGTRIRRFHVDHCHSTNVVRGLLCESCNRALGQFKDNPKFLRKAANYLENNLNKMILT